MGERAIKKKKVLFTLFCSHLAKLTSMIWCRVTVTAPSSAPHEYRPLWVQAMTTSQILGRDASQWAEWVIRLALPEGSISHTHAAAAHGMLFKMMLGEDDLTLVRVCYCPCLKTRMIQMRWQVQTCPQISVEMIHSSSWLLGADCGGPAREGVAWGCFWDYHVT